MSKLSKSYFNSAQSLYSFHYFKIPIQFLKPISNTFLAVHIFISDFIQNRLNIVYIIQLMPQSME